MSPGTKSITKKNTLSKGLCLRLTRRKIEPIYFINIFRFLNFEVTDFIRKSEAIEIALLRPRVIVSDGLALLLPRVIKFLRYREGERQQ